MSKTIMIVDDSTTMRQVVSIALKGAGYNVLEGCVGAEVKLSHRADQELSQG